MTRRAPSLAVTWVGTRPFLSAARIRRAVRAALEDGGRPDLELSVVLLPDRQLARLHAAWLGDPSPTDVITFDLSDELGAAGEVYASWECARRTARARGVDPRRELALYLVHGALHLCGLDDRTPVRRARMRTAEARVLRRDGWPVDRLPHDVNATARRAGP